MLTNMYVTAFIYRYKLILGKKYLKKPFCDILNDTILWFPEQSRGAINVHTLSSHFFKFQLHYILRIMFRKLDKNQISFLLDYYTKYLSISLIKLKKKQNCQYTYVPTYTVISAFTVPI